MAASGLITRDGKTLGPTAFDATGMARGAATNSDSNAINLRLTERLQMRRPSTYLAKCPGQNSKQHGPHFAPRRYLHLS